MPNKNHSKAPSGLREGINTRANVSFLPNSAREDDNSVEFVLTTEYPATIFDWSRFDFVKEVLRADGLKLPQNRQVPLLNSHDRGSIENILGSVRDIRAEGDKVVGRLYFSSTPAAQEAFQKIKEGHLDSGSVGYSQEKSQWIEKGESFNYNGEEYRGEMLLTTAWQLKEYSLVAIGADPFAKARAEADVLPVPETEKTEETKPETTSREAVDNTLKEKNDMDEKTKVEQPQIDTEAIKREAVKAEKERCAKINEICTRHNVTELASKLIEEGAEVERAQAVVLEALAGKTVPVAGANVPDIEIGREAKEKFRDAAVDSIILRAGMSLNKPADGAMELRSCGYSDIARHILEDNGISTRNMGKTQLIERALSTSDFDSVLANVSNKAMMIGFQAAPSTWRMWAKSGMLPDFKTATRARLTDAPDMLLNLAGDQIESGVIGDTGEEITLKTYARKLVITRQALVNDDMRIFDTIFRAFGYRAANNIEAAAYGVLTDNANMSDGGALFNTTAVTTTGGHANRSSSGAVVSATTVDAAQIAMGAQEGENGLVLSLMPKFIVGGFANKVAIELLANSTSYKNSDAYEGYNPFDSLIPVISGHVPGKKWFAIADKNMIDTVEVAFLNGQEAPTMYQELNNNQILGKTFVAYIDYAAKALEWRSMYYNAGV